MASKINDRLNGEEPAVTSAFEWRSPYEQGVKIRLVSGNIARIRPVNLDTFIQSGYIPNNLLPLIEEMFINTQTDTSKKITLDEYLDEHLVILNAFCKTCFVEPEVVDEITDPQRQITPAQISNDDKQDLIAFLGRPARVLAEFHPLTQKSLVNLADQSGAAASTEPDAAD